MLFCQLAQAKSIREICGGLACCIGKLRHLGMQTAPKKSTLSYANAQRPWQMYKDLFYQSLATCKTAALVSTNSDSTTDCSPLTAAPYHYAWLCFHGQNFAGQKAPLNCICCLTMTAICPPMPISPMAKNMMLPLPVPCPLPQGLLWPWTGDTMIINCLPPGQHKAFSLLHGSKTMLIMRLFHPIVCSLKPEHTIGSTYPFHWILCPKGLPPHPSQSCRLGRRKTAGNRSAYQSPCVWLNDDLSNLQRPVAN